MNKNAKYRIIKNNNKETSAFTVLFIFFLLLIFFICFAIIYNWCSCVQGPGPHQKPPGSISTVWMVDICWMPKDDSTLDSSMGSVLNTIRKSPAGGRGRHIILNTPILIYSCRTSTKKRFLYFAVLLQTIISNQRLLANILSKFAFKFK